MESEGLMAQEFANLCGVSKDTLLYYDKIGLFQPAATGSNGYRLYSLDQVHTFDLLLMLRDSHVPLKTIKTYLQDCSPERMLPLLREQVSVLREKLCRLEGLCNRLEFTAQQVERGMGSPQREPSVARLEEKLYSVVPVEAEVLNDRKRRMAAVRKFLRECQAKGLQGDYLRCGVISQQTLLNGCTDKEYFGVLLPPQERKALSTIPTIRRPAGEYALLRHYGGYRTLPRSYEKLLTYIKKEGLFICGNAYETELIGYLCTSNDVDYVIEIAVQVGRPQ